MATGRVPTTANSPLTAKGDLFGYSTTQARVAVGNDGETLVADSSTSTGLRYQANFSAGKNKIINGDFGIWQRGTSFTPGLDTFTADRFKTYFEGAGTTRSITQQTFTPGTAPVAGYEGKFFLRYNQSVGPSGAIGNNLLMYNIEDVRTFAGQTITFSFWAKAAATTVLPQIYAFQVFGSGGSPSGNVQTTFANNVSVGTSWTRYSYTVDLPSISGKTIGTNNDSYLAIRIQHPLGAGNTFTFDYWGWQVEAANTATAFQTATGTIQGELAACQRYYYRSTTTNTYGRLTGYTPAASTTGVYLTVQPPVKPRVPITAVDYSLVALYDGTNVVSTISSISVGDASNDVNTVNISATGLTQFRPYAILAGGNASAYIGFSSEL